MDDSTRRSQFCQILGVSPNADLNEIHQTYLDLVQVWHPDRFQDARLKRRVEERLKEINRAYEALLSEPAPAPPSQPASGWPSQPSVSWLKTAGPLQSALVAGGLLAAAFVIFIFAYFVAKRGSSAGGRAALRNPQPTLRVNPSGDVGSSGAPPAQSGARAVVAVPRPQAPSKRSRRAEPPPGNEAPSQPPTGELDRAIPPFGAGKLTISNQTGLDAFVRVVPQTTRSGAVRAIYIRAAESYGISDLPVGQFLVYVDLGTEWLAGKRLFTQGPRQTDPIGPFNYVQVLSTKGVGADDYHIALKAPAD